MSEFDGTCSRCGSDDLIAGESEFGTGVVAPDGVEERRYGAWYECRECGLREEL